ncbi:MAG: endolytic transglycosylase MltG [Peptococcia bacterium]
MNPILRKKSRPRVFQILIIVIAVLLIFCAYSYNQYQSLLGPADINNSEEVVFIIERGSSAIQIANKLEQEGLIKNAKAFLLYARLTENLEKFKAGEYLLRASNTGPEIMDILVEGRIVTVSFTIPEGYTLKKIAATLAEKGIVAEEEFWSLVEEGEFDYEFLQNLPKSKRRLEGYLFPDTYIIPKGWPAEKVIDLMLKRFAQIYDQLPPNKSGLNMRDTVILASIVEAESKVDEDRPLIASVFLNRLKINMLLQADATLQYAFEERKDRVLYKDLELDDPYNTYKYGGLTPGPIGSPGKASLEAVCEPANTEYYYFVARKDGSGKHEFSKTLAEHNAWKRKLGY